MDGVWNVYKPAGWNLTGTIEVWRNRHPEFKDASITFAGRLDPLAEGVLLLLTGDAIKEKESYLGLDKTYEATFLLGFETDTFDILGLPIESNGPNPDYEDIKEGLNKLAGSHKLKVPAYASIPLNGTPLFELARSGRLDPASIPERLMKVSKIELIGITDLNREQLAKEIDNRVSNVNGDFRQESILAGWRKLLASGATCSLASASIDCASGTYIRSLADYLGKQLGTGACLFALKRTRVGDFKIEDSEHIQ